MHKSEREDPSVTIEKNLRHRQFFTAAMTDFLAGRKKRLPWHHQAFLSGLYFFLYDSDHVACSAMSLNMNGKARAFLLEQKGNYLMIKKIAKLKRIQKKQRLAVMEYFIASMALVDYYARLQQQQAAAFMTRFNFTKIQKEASFKASAQKQAAMA